MLNITFLKIPILYSIILTIILLLLQIFINKVYIKLGETIKSTFTTDLQTKLYGRNFKRVSGQLGFTNNFFILLCCSLLLFTLISIYNSSKNQMIFLFSIYVLEILIILLIPNLTLLTLVQLRFFYKLKSQNKKDAQKTLVLNIIKNSKDQDFFTTLYKYRE